MSRNDNAYNVVDTIETPRSHWTRNWTHKTSFNAGKLIPFYVDGDIIPGSTIKNKTSVVIRMATPMYPVMDNVYLDTYYFKCSKFWYWEHFRAQHGENNQSAWTQTIEYTTPTVKLENNENSLTYSKNDLACYMGVPIGIKNISWDRWAIGAYIDIWNIFFRSENLQAPIQIDKTDSDLIADGTINTGFGLLPVCKMFDYFTCLLPQPQKGEAVKSPIGETAPIKGDITWSSTNTSVNGSLVGLGMNSGGNALLGNYGSGNPPQFAQLPAALNNTLSVNNLYADLSNAVAATINAQRLAFATQRILEKDGRFGTRYPELLKGQYGVTAADETLLIPEYLGGSRIPIHIEQVAQTSSTDSTSPLGETGAFSITANIENDFTKSFTKHDIIIGVLCVRADHTYQQGLPRQFKRPRRLDTYYPSMAHIGNQPVYNYEIFMQGKDEDNQVFGYKEAWQEYLYKPSMISGEMLSTAPQSLDAWHYGDDYNSLPVLSDEWIREPTEFIDRTLAVQSSTSNQFWADIYIEQDVAAPIPLNRVPGLIDHF